MTPLGSPFSEALDAQTAFAKEIEIIATRGGQSALLTPVSGSITQDARRSMRWDASFQIAADVGDVSIPVVPGDLLTPFGTVVSIRLGLELADGSKSLVPSGVFFLQQEDVAISGSQRVLRVVLVDLANRLASYRFEWPTTVVAGTDLATAVNVIVQDRLGTSPGLPATGLTLTRDWVFGLEAEKDPWRELNDLVKSFGYRIWYDRSGMLRLDQEPIPSPLAAIPFGGELTITGAFDHRPPNVIVARGEASDDTPPIQAVAMDLDPSSPTYAGAVPGGSDYGRVTRYFASPLLTTQAQADQAAFSILASEVARPAAWTVSKAYDPEVDPDDVLTIPLTPSVILPLLVDSVTIDIAGTTTVATRAISSLV